MNWGAQFGVTQKVMFFQACRSQRFRITEAGPRVLATVLAEPGRKLLESEGIKPKLLWRFTKVRDSRKIQCPSRNALGNDQGQPERPFMAAKPAKLVGWGCPSPLRFLSDARHGSVLHAGTTELDCSRHRGSQLPRIFEGSLNLNF